MDRSRKPRPFISPPPAERIEEWTYVAAADFEHNGFGRRRPAGQQSGRRHRLALSQHTQTARCAVSQGAEREIHRARRGSEPRRPDDRRLERRRLPDLILCKPRQRRRGLHPVRLAADGLSPRRIDPIKLDYIPYYDARFGVADFAGDRPPGLAGFGRTTGTMGVYIWLQTAETRADK